MGVPEHDLALGAVEPRLGERAGEAAHLDAAANLVLRGRKVAREAQRDLGLLAELGEVRHRRGALAPRDDEADGERPAIWRNATLRAERCDERRQVRGLGPHALLGLDQRARHDEDVEGGHACTRPRRARFCVSEAFPRL